MAMKGIASARATFDMAMLTPVFEPPSTMVRPLWSAHSRNFDAPMSGLFWWSVVSTVIFLPRTVPPKSAIAMLIGFDAALADHVGIDARQIVDVADDHLIVGGHAPMTRQAAAHERDAPDS